jgi:hypothetical protein
MKHTYKCVSTTIAHFTKGHHVLWVQRKLNVPIIWINFCNVVEVALIMTSDIPIFHFAHNLESHFMYVISASFCK